MIINTEILLCKLNILSSIYRDFPIWILFHRQKPAPKLWWQFRGGEKGILGKFYLLLR